MVPMLLAFAHPHPFPPPHVQLLRVPINHNIMICFMIAHNKKGHIRLLGMKIHLLS
jgi:hypothetical protein